MGKTGYPGRAADMLFIAKNTDLKKIENGNSHLKKRLPNVLVGHLLPVFRRGQNLWSDRAASACGMPEA